jgi:hypothetical protein
MAEAIPDRAARKAERRTNWGDWYNELLRETHRSAALVGAAFLDAWLEEALKSFLVPDVKEVG